MISIDSLLGNNGPSYSEAIAGPYREELVRAGFAQMLTPADVDAALNRNDGKIILVVLNSVCGCSARVGRPGAILSLFNHTVPDELYTLFAGMEKDAVAHFRLQYLNGITPSSPNILIFKDGKMVHILHRYQVEKSGAGDIADELINVYNTICTKQNSNMRIDELRRLFIEQYQVDPLSAQPQ